MAIIQARGLTKSYGALQVLKGVDLDIHAGEVIAIIGKSGAGKSTLLQILGTLDRPNDGTVMLDGTDPLALNNKQLAQFRNEKIGFIFQFHHLLPEFSAVENVFIPGLIGNKSKNELKQRAEQLLDQLGLADRLQHKPSELSGGEQQRVAVARALMNEPAVIFADEPSGNLDTVSSQELHQLFFDLQKAFNQTFVIVTHNMELAQLCDRQLVMENGKIIETLARKAR